MSNSTSSRRRTKAARVKPSKPYPDFPLTANGNGQWSKKIRGKVYYFGPWEDPDGALSRFLDVKDDLKAGRKPRKGKDGLTVAELCNRFLEAKERLLNNGEIVRRTFDDYLTSCQRITKVFARGRLVADLGPEDFAKLRAGIAKGRGLVALGNEIQRIRTVFKFGYDEGLIDQPIRYGQSFKKPSRKAAREARNRTAARMMEADEIRQLLDESDIHLRAMILLGVNCGFGNSDVGRLPIQAVDLGRGWIDYPRPKTGVPRRCPLWPETVKALRESLAARKAPKSDDHSGLFFITKYGTAWAKEDHRGPLVTAIRRLLIDLGLHKKGRGFYSLRHVTETIGGEAKDQVAVNAIMGHVDESMAATYRERISDERLSSVSDHIRGWLFGTGKEGSGADDRQGEPPETIPFRTVG